MLGNLIHQPNLWELNRYSVSMAFSVGLFSALIPFPAQMLIAAILAIIFKANLLISVSLVWVSNPLTSPILAFICYKIGVLILDRPEYHFSFQFSFKWLTQEFHTIGIPFIVGSFVGAILLAIIANIFIRVLWRIGVTILWQRRKNKKTVNRDEPA